MIATKTRIAPAFLKMTAVLQPPRNQAPKMTLLALYSILKKMDMVRMGLGDQLPKVIKQENIQEK